MIEELKISNFRCYRDSTIKFNGTSILVGKNNAGKSTLIEALKIISSITRKYKTLRFSAPPSWIEERVSYGVSPNVENMNISDRGIFYMYGMPPAIIEATFSNGTSIKAFVGEWLNVFAVIYDSDGCAIRNSKEAKLVDIPVIDVLPQISAVLDKEKILKKQTVDGNRFTRLASRNFRNQLFYYGESFPEFKSLVESTWETLRVSPIESHYDTDGQFLQLFVRVQDFEAEIGWMGHGLQMWIQAMWFISQCSPNAIVVLDEPDVYMHADLQRRLVRLITPMFPQVIIATHSIEIIEEVSPDCIIPINSHNDNIVPMGDEFSLNSLYNSIGATLNIDLARLYISSLFLIWEGDETSRRILSGFQSILYPQDLYPLINLPKAYINNWNEWDKITSVTNVLSSNKICNKIFCIFNSSLNAEEDIEAVKSKANADIINIHIWSKFEIDNYAINPAVILKYISNNKKKGTINKNVLETNMLKIATGIIHDNECYKHLKKSTKDINIIYDKVSGKEFFNRLSIWTQQKYGISISARQIVGYFNQSEVPEEIKSVIVKIMQLQRN